MSPSKTTCLLPSPAGGVDEEVVGFLSHLKEVTQLRKVEITVCRNLSPSLISTICEGLCSNNSMEEVEVEVCVGEVEVTTMEEVVVTAPEVSVLFVCLTTPCTNPLFSVSKPTHKHLCPHKHKLPLEPSTLVWLHLTGDSPFFLSLGGAPMMLYN